MLVLVAALVAVAMAGAAAVPWRPAESPSPYPRMVQVVAATVTLAAVGLLLALT